ncbi:2OG-Fe(II) oxygenase [Aurantiacibacter zhengii]|uniref:2OG-Fe(II) oxygenase n=2 Tax=Aurantiacibacter zhengii TaxID=2307003 RepID=A0A418NR07_9SPHN|nr:2OG-Fe(II) oxygenase [Aurantiacibacter zhengii]
MADPAKLAAIGQHVKARLDTNPQAQPLGGEDADIYLLPEFLSRAECKRLLRTVDTRIGPSELFAGTHADGFRTSSTHYFDRDDEATRELEQRMDSVLGMDHSHAEVPQGQRYRTGQQFRHHYDYFTTDQPYWQQERKRGGQRSWTAMIFLNEPGDGGETDFPDLRLSVRPQRGAMLTWNNMGRDGLPNPATLHAGMPVTQGDKYIVTQWYRQEAWSLELR